MGCDGYEKQARNAIKEFQSTQPEWAATVLLKFMQSGKTISIHAARMGCDIYLLIAIIRSGISIHAARMGCDEISKDFYRSAKNISIHASRMGCYFNP